MAKKSLIVKCKKAQETALRAISSGNKPKFSTRVYNRCAICGRSRGYLGLFKMCRMCFRKNADDGLIPGVTKSSW